MIKGGRMSGKSIDLGESKGKFDTIFISMSIEEWNKNQKKLNALEIIKEKGIDIDALKYHKDLEHYNFSLRGRYESLTQEEYDLLKEVLL